MTEALYLFLSLGAIYLLFRYRIDPSTIGFFPAAVLTGFVLPTRYIGIFPCAHQQPGDLILSTHPLEPEMEACGSLLTPAPDLHSPMDNRLLSPFLSHASC
jgi:hypothetical protein